MNLPRPQFPTNRLALYLVLLITIGLFMGFLLAVYSIRKNYVGALACFTIVFTPIGTAVSIVLNSIVQKSRAENTGGDGTGVKFAAAQAENFGMPKPPEVNAEINKESPPI